MRKGKGITRLSTTGSCWRALALSVGMLAALPGAADSQDSAVDVDTVRAGRFDFGKMWTFEYAPSAYFTTTYGFDANREWFDRARLSVLRIPGCSASFVSPNGLVATNHHCVRGAVTRVTREDESLLDQGFYAPSLGEERRIPRYYADQLIAIQDVSDEVFKATDRVAGDDEREQVREEMLEAIKARLLEQYADEGDSVWVQTVALYHGGRHSAYVFRRFTDVRLVVAAELQMGFFGGDADNFTYPRYDLDFAFLRIYDSDGNPYQPQHYFGWSIDGVEEGDIVFVIGNPGSTNRLRTIAQLEYQRDVQVPALVEFLDGRLNFLNIYREAEPEAAERMNIRNRMFGLSNSLKASEGRLAALRDPIIMAKKRDAERQLREAMRGDAKLTERYGSLFERIAEVQQGRYQHAGEFGAFLAMGTAGLESALLLRAMAARRYLNALGGAAPADSLEAFKAALLGIRDHAPRLERLYLTARLTAFQRYLGVDHPITQSALRGQSPADAAAALLQNSVLADEERTAKAVADNEIKPKDPAIRVADAFLPAYEKYREASREFAREEEQLESDLGRLRFAVYGRDIPPDGTFSPRITDGVVMGYEYNGTQAPPYTTFFGLYDRYNSHGPGTEWDLPGRWRTPPAGLQLSTPLNFVSTADTYGGNSGSPAVTPLLELVGLNFDRNIEGLSRDFIYLPERGRNVMVDVRAISAALDHVYDADRIVMELMTGRLFESETAADEAAR
jgi:hypothetical protein